MNNDIQDLIRQYLYSDLVTVNIEDKVAFHISRKALCQQSHYFDRLFNGWFEESTTGVCRLQDVRVGIFRTFLSFCLSGRLCYIPENTATSPTNKMAKELDDYDGSLDECECDPCQPQTWYWQTLLDLYVLGDRFDAAKFLIEVLDAMAGKVRMDRLPPSVEQVKYAFDNVGNNSPLRRFLIHVYAYYSVLEKADDAYYDLPIEFVVGVMRTQTHRLPGNQCNQCYESAMEVVKYNEIDTGFMPTARDCAPLEIDTCHYHEHLDESQRAECKMSRSSNATSHKKQDPAPLSKRWLQVVQSLRDQGVFASTP